MVELISSGVKLICVRILGFEICARILGLKFMLEFWDLRFLLKSCLCPKREYKMGILVDEQSL